MYTTPRSVLARWTPLALLAVALPALVFLAVQQSQRRDADQPQVQLAEDIARALDRGTPPVDVLPATRVDIATSLAPFTIIYDSLGRVLAGNGWLHDTIPIPPRGVLDFTRAHGEERVSWRPAPGLRFAAVLAHSSNGMIVLAARSLREAERAIAATRQLALIAALLTLAITLLAVVIGDLTRTNDG